MMVVMVIHGWLITNNFLKLFFLSILSVFCTVNIDYFVNRKIDTYDIYGGTAHLQGSAPLILTWRSSGVVMAVRWRNSCFVWNILD